MPRRRPESDVQRDPAVSRSREAGGVDDPGQPDQHTTTGTTPNEEFVGRVTGEDPGAVGETGAERRAEANRENRPPSSGRSDATPGTPDTGQ